MKTFNEFKTQLGASVGVSTAIIICAVCSFRGHFEHSVQISLAAIVGHLVGGLLIPAFPISPTLVPLVSAAVPLLCAATAWTLDISPAAAAAAFLDEHGVFYWYSVLFALFEAFQMHLLIAFVSEKVRLFLGRKVHGSPNRNAALPYFILVLLVTIACYALSAAALFDGYEYVTSLTLRKETARGHVMAIAAVAALAVVVTAYAYESECVGIQFSAMVTLYASVVARKAALSVRAVKVSGNRFSRMVTTVSGVLSRVFSGGNPNKFVSKLGVHDLVGIALHGLAVLLMVLCPQSFMTRRDKSKETVLAKTLATTCALFGLMSSLIASLSTHTNTEQPSPLWMHVQSILVLLVSINYVHYYR